jgi:hypothetical protein
MRTTSDSRLTPDRLHPHRFDSEELLPAARAADLERRLEANLARLAFAILAGDDAPATVPARARRAH